MNDTDKIKAQVEYIKIQISIRDELNKSIAEGYRKLEDMREAIYEHRTQINTP